MLRAASFVSCTQSSFKNAGQVVSPLCSKQPVAFLLSFKKKNKKQKPKVCKKLQSLCDMPVLMTSPTPLAPPLPPQPHWPLCNSLNHEKPSPVSASLPFCPPGMLLHRGIQDCAFSSSGLCSDTLYQEHSPWEPCLTWLLPFAPFWCLFIPLVLWKVPPLHCYFTACCGFISSLPTALLNMCVSAHLLSHVWLFATLWTVAHQAPLSMGLEYWSGLPFPTPGNLPDLETEPASLISPVQFSSVAQSCLTLCDPMNRSTPGLPVQHRLPEFTQTHVHRVSDAIQPSHTLSSPSPPAPNPSQHQSLFQWVNSSHEVAKVLEFQL